MLYLADLTLKYAIDKCLAKPNYSVAIGVLEKTDIIRCFDFLNQNISERRKTKNIPDVFVINRPSVKFDNIQTQNEIIFSNGSRISIILPSASKRCIRCHLLIIDNRIDIDTQGKLRTFEIRDYNKEKELEETFNKETKRELTQKAKPKHIRKQKNIILGIILAKNQKVLQRLILLALSSLMAKFIYQVKEK